MSKELKFEFNDYIIAIDEPYENDCGYVAIGKKQSNGISIVFKSPNEKTVNWFIELQKHITNLQSQLDQLKQQLEIQSSVLKQTREKLSKAEHDRDRYRDKIKEQQEQLAIQELEKVKEDCFNQKELVDFGNVACFMVDITDILEIINNQIKKLKGE